MKYRTAAAHPLEPNHPGAHRRPTARKPRRIAALVAALTLVLGSGLAMELPATAGPTDPITMPDDNLRACINTQELGQGPTEPISENQAANITGFTCQNLGITDITGLETMTSLERFYLDNNAIASLAPLMNLTSLTWLNLNGVGATDTDVLGFSQLPNMTYLSLSNNEITDVSALADATALEYLYLARNKITDISTLATLTNLDSGGAKWQALSLPAAPSGSATANPVTDPSNTPVPVTSSDTGFSYNSTTNAWSFSTMGNKTLSWNTTVTIGAATDFEFSGTIDQQIDIAEVAPEDPTVIQAVCKNGDVAYPQITLPTTKGITYMIDGAVAPGNTVTIEAVPADGNHAIYVGPDSDWVGDSDHIYASLEITLDNPDCDAPEPTVIDAPNGDLPVDDPCGPDNATWRLPTGTDVPVGFTWKVNSDGLLTAEANNDYVFADPSGTMDPTLREYGYAPDTNEACPATSDTDGDTDDPVDTDEQVDTTGNTLPKTGGPSAAAGILAAGLLGIGGVLVLTDRVRRQRA
ncbi:LPXTG cell wall anchor domain-containing protein [Jonesiaceae bacterium BS-20]|uniref:LPXTG cell wall anchor domain-containing protein n=1 Tax=Jonesiaceae bacterium BS-20 TaxID=3120821 RepID=A0AAU7DT09_9MICO